jgi:hypothetical protein
MEPRSPCIGTRRFLRAGARRPFWRPHRSSARPPWDIGIALAGFTLAVWLAGCGRIGYERLEAVDAQGRERRDGGRGDARAGDARAGDAAEADATAATDAASADATAATDAAPDAAAGGGEPCRDAAPGACSGSSVTVSRFSAPSFGAETLDGADDYAGSCGGAGAGDIGLQVVALDAGRYEVSVEGSSFDMVVYVRDGTDCTGEELACGETVEVALTAGQQVVAIADGVGGLCGSARISTRYLGPL